jgi:Ras-related protein Rab-11A
MLDDDNYDLIFKIVLIGDSGVGKTNILSRYINNEFSLATQSTVGVEFGSKIIKKNGKVIKLQIWDTAGQERYKSITSAYYKGSRGAFVVYDITRKTTYDNIDKWIGELKTNGSEDVLIMLVGNKSDLEDKREVITEEVEKKAQEQKLAFCETSALNGKNVEYAFENLINEILKKVEKDKINEAKQLSESKAITLETADKNQNEKNSKKKKKCC